MGATVSWIESLNITTLLAHVVQKVKRILQHDVAYGLLLTVCVWIPYNLRPGCPFSRYEQFETSPETIEQDCDLPFANTDIQT